MGHLRHGGELMSGIALLLAGLASAGFSATASPPSLRSGGVNTGAPFTSAPTTAIPTGGTGPYTYAWTLTTAPDVGSITINTPAAAGTTVTFDGYAELDTVEGTITGTVTDTSNGHTTTVDVVVSHHYLGEI